MDKTLSKEIVNTILVLLTHTKKKEKRNGHNKSAESRKVIEATNSAQEGLLVIYFAFSVSEESVLRRWHPDISMSLWLYSSSLTYTLKIQFLSPKNLSCIACKPPIFHSIRPGPRTRPSSQMHVEHISIARPYRTLF